MTRSPVALPRKRRGLSRPAEFQACNIETALSLKAADLLAGLLLGDHSLDAVPHFGQFLSNSKGLIKVLMKSL